MGDEDTGYKQIAGSRLKTIFYQYFTIYYSLLITHYSLTSLLITLKRIEFIHSRIDTSIQPSLYRLRRSMRAWT